MNFSDASDIRLGNNTITALYYGSTLIWPLGPTPPTPTDWSTEYLQTTLLSAGSLTFEIGTNITTSDLTSISYSFDKINWTTTLNDDNRHSPIDIKTSYSPANTVIYWKGIGSKLSAITNGCRLNIGTSYIGDGLYFNVAGNIMSLLYGDNFIGQTTLSSEFTFYGFFHGLGTGGYCCADASNLILPATTLTTYCYANMFEGNTQLITAPVLPASTLVDFCYYRMFSGCTNLNYVKCLATDKSAEACTREWLNYVTATGTFVKDANTSWATGVDGIPSGWTVQNI